MNAPICVLACSPRKGNSDAMAEHFVQGVQSLGGNATTIWLREHTFMPCTSCGACTKHPLQQCVLHTKDNVEHIFAHILKAQLVFLAAPIYFYHLPAHTKALIDRAQALYMKREYMRKNAKHTVPQNKVAMVGLVAARLQGEHIFAGSMLTLKYFFDVFDYKIHDKELIYGFDASHELAQSHDSIQRFFSLGQRAQQYILEPKNTS